MTNYPQMIAVADHVEPVPRRIRATLAGAVIVDTTRALYVWEWPNYPQYYIPIEDVNTAYLVDEQHPQQLKRGSAQRYGLVVGHVSRPRAVRVYTQSTIDQLTGTARFEWDALDSWFEEDEEVFVHPRNPYTRGHDERLLVGQRRGCALPRPGVGSFGTPVFAGGGTKLVERLPQAGAVRIEVVQICVPRLKPEVAPQGSQPGELSRVGRVDAFGFER